MPEDRGEGGAGIESEVIQEKFPRSHRIRTGKDYRRVLRQGARVEGKTVLLFYLRNPHAARAGFVVGRKVGDSVTRHHVTRILREVYRRNRAILQPGFDVVFRAKEGAAQADYWSLRDEIAELYARARILKGDEPGRKHETQ